MPSAIANISEVWEFVTLQRPGLVLKGPNRSMRPVALLGLNGGAPINSFSSIPFGITARSAGSRDTWSPQQSLLYSSL